MKVNYRGGMKCPEGGFRTDEWENKDWSAELGGGCFARGPGILYGSGRWLTAPGDL